MRNNYFSIILLGLLLCSFTVACVESSMNLQIFTKKDNGALSDSEFIPKKEIDQGALQLLTHAERTRITLPRVKKPIFISFNSSLSESDILSISNKYGLSLKRHSGHLFMVGNWCVLENSIDLNVLNYLKQIGVVMDVYVSYIRRTPFLEHSVPNIDADVVWSLRDKFGQNVTGKGVKVAIIDTGIDWQHPDFYYPSDTKYIIRYDSVWYVDLNNNGIYDSNETLKYIDELNDYNNAGFDARYDWLVIDVDNNGKYTYGQDYIGVLDDLNSDGSYDVNEFFVPLEKPKIVSIWDQETGKFFYRGVNLTDPLINDETDSNGHGTHVAGIVAGGPLGYHNIVGVAPNAELIIIKTTFYDDDIIDAIYWAVEQGADIISMSLGGHIFSPHDGSSPLEQAVDYATSQNVSVVVSAGNEGNSQIHAMYKPNYQETVTFEINVSASDLSEYYITFLWTDATKNYTLTLISPGGASIVLDGSGQSTLLADGHNVTSYWDTTSRGTTEFDVVIRNGSNLCVSSGIWKVNITNNQNILYPIHGYVYPEDDVYFTTYYSTQYTIASPATADTAIAVASYVTYSAISTIGAISSFSSKGPRIDGIQKPLIAAPGESILSAASSAIATFGSHKYMAGTSMAAPHVAGVIALMLQVKNYTPSEVVDVLKKTATNDSFTGTTPNYSWGYGKVNASHAVCYPAPTINNVVIDDIQITQGQGYEFLQGAYLNVTANITDVTNSNNDLTVIFKLKDSQGTVLNETNMYFNDTLALWQIFVNTSEYPANENLTAYIFAKDPIYSSSFEFNLTFIVKRPVIYYIYYNVSELYRLQSVYFKIRSEDADYGTNLQVFVNLTCISIDTHVSKQAYYNATLNAFTTIIPFNKTNPVGLWHIVVTSRNPAGNSTVKDGGYIDVKNNLPYLIYSNRKDFEVVAWRGNSSFDFILNASDIDSLSLADITVIIAANHTTYWLNVTTSFDGLYWTGMLEIPLNSPTGNYSVFAVITDADNGTVTILLGTIIVKNVPPKLLSYWLSSSSVYRVKDQLKILANVYDQDNLTSDEILVYLYLTSAEHSFKMEFEYVNATYRELDVTFNSSFPIGEYNATIAVKDRNGAITQVNIGMLSVLNNPPNVTGRLIPSRVKQGDSFIVSLEISDEDNAITSVHILVRVVDSDGNILIETGTQLQTTKVNVSISTDDLSVGTYTIVVVAEDPDGGTTKTELGTIAVQDELNYLLDTEIVNIMGFSLTVKRLLFLAIAVLILAIIIKRKRASRGI